MSGGLNFAFDRRFEGGPFDIIGDVHGCGDELEILLQKLGYSVTWHGLDLPPETTAPAGRRAIFVGDLVDRGPRAADSVAIVMAMCDAGQALCVAGNHDVKFRRWLDCGKVSMTHGLQITADDYAGRGADHRVAVSHFIRALPAYLWLDAGRLVVAHAGIQAAMIGHISHKIEHFCLYGDTDNRTDPTGLPQRYNWAARYDGSAMVVYGHTPVVEAAWLNGTACIDTGCCFGGALTALRYPEREIVSVPARASYARRQGVWGLPPTR